MSFTPASNAPDQSRWRLFSGWQTLTVIAFTYTLFGAVTANYEHLPGWLAALLGSYAVGLHGSLQHEIIHGHPTRSAWVNEFLVFPSLWLWLPFAVYRTTHLEHHRTAALTYPDTDPESYYIGGARWSGLSHVQRGFFWFHNTVLGRVAIGPLYVAVQFWWGIAGDILRKRVDRTTGKILAYHLLSCCVVLIWVIGFCAIPLLEYLALFVYPAIGLTLLRSFLEHRAVESLAQRTAVVTTNPLLNLLYLNNNLHAVHHQWPELPWYQLPDRWRSERANVLADNGNYVFSGYAQVIKRYWRRPKESPIHPLVSPPTSN